MKLRLPKLTVWRAIFAAIMLSGLYATYLRVMYGLGGSTNLSDKFPWGIWIGFDVMCGVGLAAGPALAATGPPFSLPTSAKESIGVSRPSTRNRKSFAVKPETRRPPSPPKA